MEDPVESAKAGQLPCKLTIVGMVFESLAWTEPLISRLAFNISQH